MMGQATWSVSLPHHDLNLGGGDTFRVVHFIGIDEPQVTALGLKVETDLVPSLLHRL